MDLNPLLEPECLHSLSWEVATPDAYAERYGEGTRQIAWQGASRCGRSTPCPRRVFSQPRRQAAQRAGSACSQLLSDAGREGQPACEGASGPAKVGGPVGAPEHVGAVGAQAHVQQLVNILLVPVPGRMHVRGVEARVPCAKLCTETPLCSALQPAAWAEGRRETSALLSKPMQEACVCTARDHHVTRVIQPRGVARKVCMQPAVAIRAPPSPSLRAPFL